MGYSSLTTKEFNGMPVTDFFKREFVSPYGGIIGGATVLEPRGSNYQACWYGLFEVRRDFETEKELESPQVIAYICPCDNVRFKNGNFVIDTEFGWKDMSEGDGTFYYDMPEYLFDRLTDVEFVSLSDYWKENAREWRIKVRKVIKQRNLYHDTELYQPQFSF